MALRIEKVSDESIVTLRLSGRLPSEHVDQLKGQIEGSTQRIILGLEKVKLVDRKAVRFLEPGEANGVALKQCAPYIRDWIDGREHVGVSRDPSGGVPCFLWRN